MKQAVINSNKGGMAIVLAMLIGAAGVSSVRGAGTLTARGSTDQPIRIQDHHVEVVINNGFARTEVLQTFFNPNAKDLEAIYSFPLPKSASLSEMTIWAGEKELNGEVITKKEADRIYGEEKQKGNDVGKAEKNGYQAFDFYVHPVRANAETRVRFVYYQPLEIDTGVGRYIYPLDPGGTDEQALSFWTQNQKVEGQFSVDLTCKSAHPIIDVRAPGYEAAAAITKVDDGNYKLSMKTADASLDRDFVFYYRLTDNLPGRVEVIPYRSDKDKPGTFMMVITPGIDLQPLTEGADYIYVLDKSGSMSGGKIRTLANGVAKAIGGMRPQDRFRVITFDTRAQEITSGWVTATPENIQRELQKVSAIGAGGSTDMHSGLRLALDRLDDDRATSIVLVTDGVTNTGIIDPQAFHKLIKNYDVRIFGFVMGNSANWPLMDMIGKVSGGFSAGISNDDDIVGQIMLAKSKVTHETLHDATVKISGVKVFETSDEFIGKVYRGQQLVIFGRYEKSGNATVSLNAKLTGEDKTYSTSFTFPEIDTDNPELERLWALSQIENHTRARNLGLLPQEELEDIERNLGVKYQLVTDETTMIVLADEVFTQHGIERNNKARIAVEQQAQSARTQQPVKNYTVDSSNRAFKGNVPGLGGGGALGGLSFLGIAALLGIRSLGRLSSKEQA